MWVFALPFVRRSGKFELFFYTHLFYTVWLIAFLLHAPSFLPWAAAPLAGFLLEKIVRRLRKRHPSVIRRAVLHPAGVSHLTIKKPPGFHFHPGDYLFLNVPELSRFEWHPFTISNHPEDPQFVEVHVRAVGNWTKALFSRLKDAGEREKPIRVRLNGPYGTPSAGIFDARVAVLVGAGIGVTPYASILKSILHRRRRGDAMRLKRVYFFWLNRGQRSFQWFGRLLADIEAEKLREFIRINIFMTDAKINATTGIVKIAMDLLHAETGKDLVTGLEAVTAFGRPDWNGHFEKIRRENDRRDVRVFFCGPPLLAREVRRAAHRFRFPFRREVF